MTIFKPSSETAKDPHVKVLLWGPPGAGKTHFGLSAQRPALIDVENRGSNFASRQQEFAFAHAEIHGLDELAAAFKEIKAGGLDCDSVVVDSGSAIYTALVDEHTARTDRGAYITDWVTVNRRFLKCLNFVFAISGKNVIFTAHAATKLIREGRDFRTAGLKFVGDERFRFGFDYIFRIEPKGDPARHPAIFHVEKTSSPALVLGAALTGLTWRKFRELIGSPASQEKPLHAASAPVNTEPLSIEQCERIEVLLHQSGLQQSEFVTLTKNISARRTPLYQELSAREAASMIANLERRVNERNAA